MWPMLLNLTRDECCRTLRRLELEAYSNMISVFRAQGALEDNRKKLLEELRAVLHISNDRHSAEARRVANDELLATIADRIAGPNTGLAWITEGHRRVPLLRRGIPQTMYTEIADKVSEKTVKENKELQKKIEAEKLVAAKSNEEELHDDTGQTAEGDFSFDYDEIEYPPLAMEDQANKLWDTELITRKRKVPESGAIPGETNTPPMKNMRNIPINTNQRHLNLSQIYSKFSQPTTSKASGQSKHSYNQVSKVSTSKSNQARAPRSTHKSRSSKQSKKAAQIGLSKSKIKKQKAIVNSPTKQYNPSMQIDYSGPPSSFQASYAQSVLGNKNKHDYIEDKSKLMSTAIVSEPSSMQLLPQPMTGSHDINIVSDSTYPDSHASLQAQSKLKPVIGGKPCQLIIKRGDINSDKKVQVSDIKILHKPAEGIKLLSNKQVIVAPSSTQKALNTTGKIISTKLLGSVSKPQSNSTLTLTDKMSVVTKQLSDHKSISSPKIIISSSAVAPVSILTNSATSRTTETLTPKGIPATDLKVSAKTFVLNSKSGQKMVVLPAGRKTVTDGQMPFLQLKGMPSGMKLVPVTCQAITYGTKSPSVAIVSKSNITVSTTPKINAIEPIKTANMADIVPVKGLTPVTTPKISNPVVRPASAKGNVIVLQKRATLGQTITFTKNSNDMSKIIMGKNVNKLLQASKPDQSDAAKVPGNVIVLELNNDQMGQATTMSEILDSHSNNSGRASDEKCPPITEDTPVLFDNQTTEEETGNASSIDSASESIGDMASLEDAGLLLLKDKRKSRFKKDVEAVKDSSSVTDWEIELDTVSRKEKDDKLNSLHLDLGMSSDSENEYMVETHESKNEHTSQAMQRVNQVVEGSEMYSSTSGMSLATRTLLSQLQDDGSSSNDSSFALKAKVTEKLKDCDKLDKSESEELDKAKEKLSEKVARSQQKRIDVYSTAIHTSDISLDTFNYLEESMMAGDDEFVDEKARDKTGSLDEQLSRLLGEVSSANSTDSQSVSEDLPLEKK